MAEATGLCGIGVPPEVAKRVGWRIIALTAVGTTQGGAPIVANGENVVVRLTTAGGATACTLPVNAAVGDEVAIAGLVPASPALVFPPLGQTIDGKTQNTNITVTFGALLIKSGPLTWAVVSGVVS